MSSGSGVVMFLSTRNWRDWYSRLAASSQKESSPTEASAKGLGSAGRLRGCG